MPPESEPTGEVEVDISVDISVFRDAMRNLAEAIGEIEATASTEPREFTMRSLREELARIQTSREERLDRLLPWISWRVVETDERLRIVLLRGEVVEARLSAEFAVSGEFLDQNGWYVVMYRLADRIYDRLTSSIVRTPAWAWPGDRTDRGVVPDGPTSEQERRRWSREAETRPIADVGQDEGDGGSPELPDLLAEIASGVADWKQTREEIDDDR
jgi:hypothetical protein